MDELFIKEVQKDVYKIISEMKKCKSNFSSRYRSLALDYLTIYCMCQDLNILDCLPDIDKYSYKGENLIDIDKNYIPNILKDYTENKKYYLQISSIGEKLIDKYQMPRGYRYETLLKNYLTVKDSFEIAKSFLCKYNPEIYDDCLKSIENNRFLIKNQTYTDDYGVTIYLTEAPYPYVLINNLSNLTLPFTIVHEAGHIYTNYKYKNTSYKKISNYHFYSYYKEVFSNYLELLLNKHLEDNNLFISDLNLLNKSFDLDMAELMKRFHHLLNQENEIKEDLNYYFHLCDNMFGKILAYHYYEMYLYDQELAKYNMEQFLCHMGDFNTMEMLNSFGLNSKDVLSSKILEKHIKRHFN